MVFKITYFLSQDDHYLWTQLRKTTSRGRFSIHRLYTLFKVTLPIIVLKDLVTDGRSVAAC